MATKADLEAELEDLREKLKERADQEEVSTASKQSRNALEGASSLLEELSDSELDGEGIEHLVRQLAHEIEDYQKHKPILTVAAAFSLGFLLGRSSK